MVEKQWYWVEVDDQKPLVGAVVIVNSLKDQLRYGNPHGPMSHSQAVKGMQAFNQKHRFPHIELWATDPHAGSVVLHAPTVQEALTILSKQYPDAVPHSTRDYLGQQTLIPPTKEIL